jgi:hypothetical protein
MVETGISITGVGSFGGDLAGVRWITIFTGCGTKLPALSTPCAPDIGSLTNRPAGSAAERLSETPATVRCKPAFNI